MSYFISTLEGNSLFCQIYLGCSNLLSRYFSYEHFYVIYCKFWELDTDHDFLIDKENLIRYGNHSLTYRIVDRIFSQVYPPPNPLSFSGTKGKSIIF